MAVFGEAIAAVTASCNFGVVVVAIAAVLAARGDVRVVGAVIGAALVGGWLFAADISVPVGRVGGTVLHTIVLAILVAGVFVARKRIWISAALAGAAELLATFWWRPCVGRQLASIINASTSDGGASTVVGMALYMLGLLVPAIALASVAYLVSDWFSGRRPQAAASDGGDG